ncbi:MAG: hypothetical protein KBS57_04560 [Alistipes sp.]|nr:hypothetical protein [Candidatus Minthomonas equi]
MRRYSVLTIVLVLLAGSGCSLSPRHQNAVFTTALKMEDTASVYDLWVNLVVNSKEKTDSVVLFMKIFPPDEKTVSPDTLTVPINRNMVSSFSDGRIKTCLSFFSYDVRALYRSGVRPLQSGLWKVVVESSSPVVNEVWMDAEKRDNK